MDTLQFRRNRRLRTSTTLRSMVRETVLQKEDFIYPIFVIDGEDINNPIASMPGVFQKSLDHFATELDEVVSLGIPSIILFGLPATKDEWDLKLILIKGLSKKQLALRKNVILNLSSLQIRACANIQTMVIAAF